jgi:predicted NBD/HSP70 family sugar kinase
VTGASGRSGEIGFLPLGRTRRNQGNLQDVVSLSGLRSHLADAGFADVDMEKSNLLDGELADASREWAERSAELLCEPLLVINAVINPEAIFIGGQLPAELVDLLCDQLALKIRHQGASLPARAPVRRAALAEDAAAMGAAILPFSNRFLPSREALMKTEA